MNRKNPMQDAVREIVVKTESGETLRLLTNDLERRAQEIADLYRRRWEIELFFRVVKQTLKITSFVGRRRTPCASRSPSPSSPISSCAPCNGSRKKLTASSNLFRLVRANLMHETKTRHHSEINRRLPLLDSRQLQLSFPSP